MQTQSQPTQPSAMSNLCGCAHAALWGSGGPYGARVITERQARANAHAALSHTCLSSVSGHRQNRRSEPFHLCAPLHLFAPIDPTWQ